MHILMLAPEPFFEPRGTPFSERDRIRALTTLGHTVDLVTYPFGADVSMPGLTIHRARKPPFVSRAKIGPSWAKVPLDVLLFVEALRLSRRRRYDAVHSHEEAGFFGVWIARRLGVPHLYDMHSSLPQQVKNFNYRGVPGLSAALGWIERVMIARSQVVIVVCQELETTVREIREDVPTVLIENTLAAAAARSVGSGAEVRQRLDLPADTPLVLYTGTFESYQGFDLLFGAMTQVAATVPGVKLLMVGGTPEQVSAASRQVQDLGISNSVIFTGQRPPAEIPTYLDAATVLVSPRSSGTNTPLKIYQYLGSGRPIVATNLRTHTQVLTPDTAFLAEPTPEAFGAALVTALIDRERASRIGEAARYLAETRYSEAAYLSRTKEAVALLAPHARGAVERGVA